MEFQELLERIQPEINWKVVYKDESKDVYRQVKNTYFEKLTMNECRMHVRNVKGFEMCTPATINSLTVALTEDIDRQFDDSLFLTTRKTAIGFQNGVFDLHTGKLRKYQSHDFVCDPLPFDVPKDYHPKCEEWVLTILKSWVGDDVGNWFLTLLAYMLFIYPNKEHIWLNFFGAGSNGKSVCLEMLEAMLGDAKCIGCDLKNLNRFSGDTVQGKWLVVGRDSGATVSGTGTSFIKTFSGDEKILVERKGGASFDVPNQGKLIVSSNALIRSKDRSYAWYRRLFPIPFPNSFPRNEKFKENLFQRLPEIIRVLLHRAYLYHHNEVSLFDSIPEPVQDLRKETRMLNDRVAAFWEEYFHKSDPDRPSVMTLDWRKIAETHDKTMSEVYNTFIWWHDDEFGEMSVEPSLKVFGGAYGAFLSTEAGRYFEYVRTKYGRKVKLKSRWTDYTRSLLPEE